VSINNSTGVVTYSEDYDSIKVKTSTCNASGGGSTVVNLTGDQVFNYTSGGSTQNVLNAIWGLGQAIQEGNSATVSSSITTLNDAFNHINNELSTVGSMVSDITTQQSAVTTIKTNEQSALSNLDDTNMASATTQLTQVQTAYQAALKVANTLSGLNLAAYLTGNTSI
jgi:flagellin-like hook-associated protein FlgL